jgi:hypothetical protein
LKSIRERTGCPRPAGLSVADDIFSEAKVSLCLGLTAPDETLILQRAFVIIGEGVRHKPPLGLLSFMLARPAADHQ